MIVLFFCMIISMFVGLSLIIVSIIGVVLLGVVSVVGVLFEWMVGVVICGVCFGDKMLLMFDMMNFVVGIGEILIFKYICYMMGMIVLVLLIIIVFFYIFGLFVLINVVLM